MRGVRQRRRCVPVCVTDAIANFQKSAAAAQEASGISHKSYTLYRKAREYRHTHEDGLEITNIFYNKEEVQTIRLHGTECRHCGRGHFPMIRVCARCEKSDSLQQVALERTGNIFTFAVDHLAASPFPAIVMAVVDLDGGGRIYCEVVDTETDAVSIGMLVELVMRRLREGGGPWIVCPVVSNQPIVWLAYGSLSPRLSNVKPSSLLEDMCRQGIRWPAETNSAVAKCAVSQLG